MKVRRFAVHACLGLLVAGPSIALAGPGLPRSALDRPVGLVWTGSNHWSDRLEDEYAAFIERLGAAVEAGWCSRLDSCLSDPVANTTYDEETDAGRSMQVDCADLPYVLRGYFSFKRNLPFGYVAATVGEGLDIRYAVNVRPVAWKTWRDFRTPRELLRTMTEDVHSGTYRLPAAMERSDFYPVPVNRRSVRPGTVYYDPLGHVSVVARVRADGTVFFLEGTPQSVLQWRRLGSGYSIGSAALGGGFKRFRPVVWVRGRLLRAPNRALEQLDEWSQYDTSLRVIDGVPATFHDWVRATLAVGPGADVVAELREHVRGLCRDILDRVEAVDRASRDGIAGRPHPPALPANIYGAKGEWETYATPSRDARLKESFRELAEHVRVVEDLTGLAVMLRAAWQEEVSAPGCRLAYRDSRGGIVQLTLDDVLDRLFDLSFDPYHCPELRWGAPEGSAERAACPDGKVKRAWFQAERRLRNRIERVEDEPTPLDAGPEIAPDVDVRRLFADDGVVLDL